MDLLNGLGWLGKSIIATLLATPFIVFWSVFVKTGAKPEAMICTWFTGCIIGILLIALKVGFVRVGDLSIKDFLPTIPLLIILVMGILLGAYANVLLSQAMSSAPNSALPFALFGLSSAVAFILSPVVSAAFPKLFYSANFSWVNFLGLVLLAVAVSMIVYQPTSAILSK
ncbi:MAG: hypothetical protein OEM02_03755 [Desulfobulbaceae bacterium]|nr:hypothetical protein [Desulfobulbaceae bacterium]